MRRAPLAGALALGLAWAAPARAQWRVEGAALVGRAEHRVDAGYGVASSVGTTLGLRATVRRDELIEAELKALGGRLAADSVARDDRTMGELGLRVSVLPLPWLAVHGVAEVRAYDLVPALQRWTTLGAGAELRLAFADGALRSVVGVTLLPHVAASGVAAPDMGVASAVGLRMTRGRLVAGLSYDVERYAFAADPRLGRRREQISGLSLSLGGAW
ncbi:MAG: hypothetical protein ACJ8AO_08805 [Gemmatimonadaceae bacterium]